MRVRLWDKILLAITGIFLCAVALFVLLWRVGVLNDVILIMGTDWLATGIVAGVSLLLGICALSYVWRSRRNKRGFVVQRTENGELSISIKAMEGMVEQCVDKHDELEVLNTRIDNTRDGVVVELRVSLAHGVSIPLAVNTLQKQIKQYVTACSGVDVYEVRVEVESADNERVGSPFAVPEMPVTNLTRESEAAAVKETPVQPEATVPPVPPVQPVPEPEAHEHKSIHQRLFGKKQEEATVPPPPEKDEAEALLEEKVEAEIADPREPSMEEIEEVKAQEDEKP